MCRNINFIFRTCKEKKKTIFKLEALISTYNTQVVTNLEEEIMPQEDILSNLQETMLHMAFFYHCSLNDIKNDDYDCFLQKLLFIHEYNKKINDMNNAKKQ